MRSSSPPEPAPRAEPLPPRRQLRVFAVDPSLGRSFDTSGLYELTLDLPWEGGKEPFPGPVGEYLEVVDVDPASDRFYPPIDLNASFVLASDGRAPSVTDPQFHQQMVYAVAMTTIRHFENALGRRALWSDRPSSGLADPEEAYVQRLRIYPHAFRDANAYYSPEKKALLFGYFPVREDAAQNPSLGRVVFSCLSYDVVAHETTHALLDGLHPRFVEATNPDVLALHEAFADIVAILQHFTHPTLVEWAIARVRGDLGAPSLLSQLAREMGMALGRQRALREAVGSDPDPSQLRRTTEPHARGSILLAAVFDAFLKIYGARTGDLLRLATGGSGILPAGELQRDLVRRLALEAARSAEHVLHMCIRALDYCPPVGVTFGDYLRALITADLELVPYDARSYRVAVIEAFRRRGIQPRKLHGLGEESLRWQPPSEPLPQELLSSLLQELEVAAHEAGLDLISLWTLQDDRRTIWRVSRELRRRLHGRIAQDWAGARVGTRSATQWAREELHLVLEPVDVASVSRYDARYRLALFPKTEVHSARLARRRGPRGDTQVDLVVEITQRRRGYLDAAQQARADSGEIGDDPADFTYRAGCTLLIDLVGRAIRYAIRSPGDILDDDALEAQRAHLAATSPSLRATYFSGSEADAARREPFAALHNPRRIED